MRTFAPAVLDAPRSVARSALSDLTPTMRLRCMD